MTGADHRILRPSPGAGADPRRRGCHLRLPRHAQHQNRCDPRPERHPGHRLRQVGPQSRHHRGPAHLSHHLGPAGHAQGERHPRLLRLRSTPTSTSSSTRAPTFTGRAREPSNISTPSPRACPKKPPSSWPKTQPASAGSMSTPWSMTAASTASTRCAATRTGICAMPCSRCPEWPRLPRSAASSASTRCRSIPSACRPTRFRSTPSSTPSANPTTMLAAAWSNSAAANTWCAGAAICTRSTTLETSSCSTTPAAARRFACATWPRINYGPAMRRGVTDLDGRGEAVGGVVIMRVGENAEKVIERVKEQIALLAALAAQGTARGARLRPFRTHRPRRGQPEAHPHRRAHHRQSRSS